MCIIKLPLQGLDIIQLQAAQSIQQPVVMELATVMFRDIERVERASSLSQLKIAIKYYQEA